MVFRRLARDSAQRRASYVGAGASETDNDDMGVRRSALFSPSFAPRRLIGSALDTTYGGLPMATGTGGGAEGEGRTPVPGPLGTWQNPGASRYQQVGKFGVNPLGSQGAGQPGMPSPFFDRGLGKAPTNQPTAADTLRAWADPSNPDNTGLWESFFGGVFSLFGEGAETIGRGLGSAVDLPFETIGNIGGLAGSLYTGSFWWQREGGLAPDIKQLYDDSVKENPLNALLLFGHAGKAQFQRDTEEGKYTGLNQDMGPAVALTDQLGLVLHYLMLPQRMTVRALESGALQADSMEVIEEAVNSGGTVHQNPETGAWESSDERVKNPTWAAIQMRLGRGDYGAVGSKEARDKIVDDLIVAGEIMRDVGDVRQEGLLTGQGLADLALGIVSDPLIIASSAVGAGAKVAKAGRVAANAKVWTVFADDAPGRVLRASFMRDVERVGMRMGGFDTPEALWTTLGRSRGVSGRAGPSQRGAVQVGRAADPNFETAVFREALQKKKYASIRPQLEDSINYIERWRNTWQPVLEPIAETVRVVNDPLRLFGIGKNGQRANGVFGWQSAEGTARGAGSLNALTTVTRDMDGMGGAIGTVGKRAFGVYSANLSRAAFRNQLVKQIRRKGAVPPQWGNVPDLVIGKQMAGARGVDIATMMERIAQRVRPLYLGKGGVERGRVEASRRLQAMGATVEQADGAVAKYGRDELSIVEAMYYGHTTDEFVKAKDIAIRDMGAAKKAAKKAGREYTGLPMDRLTPIGPKQLTESRANAVLADARAGRVEKVREARATYDTLDENFEDSLSDSDLLAAVRSLLEDGIKNKSFPTELGAEDFEKLGVSLREWTERNADIGYVPGFRPDDENMWRLTMTEDGGRIVGVNPWTDVAGTAADVRQYTDWQLARDTLTHAIRGERIMADARQRLAIHTTEKWGISRSQSDALFARFLRRAEESGITPRGLSPEAITNIVKTHGLNDEVIEKIGVRESTEALVLAFEGYLKHVGLTQKFTGKLKTGTAGNSNWIGHFAENIFPAIRFRLNPVFQAMELTEPFVLNIMRGVKPGFRASEADKATLHLIHTWIRDSRYAIDDMTEKSGLYLWGADSANKAMGATTRLGKLVQKVTLGGLLDVKQVKLVNYARAMRKEFGREFEESMATVMPDLMPRLIATYGTSDAGEIAVRWFSEKAFATEQRSMAAQRAAMKPANLGARAPVNVDHLPVFFDDIEDYGGLRKALADRSISPEDFHDTLIKQGADPDYAIRAYVTAARTYVPDEYWEAAKDVFPGGATNVRMVRSMVQARAARMGVSEDEFMARNLADLPVSGHSLALATAAPAEKRNLLLMAEAADAVNDPERLGPLLQRYADNPPEAAARKNPELYRVEELQPHVFTPGVMPPRPRTRRQWAVAARDLKVPTTRAGPEPVGFIQTNDMDVFDAARSRNTRGWNLSEHSREEFDLNHAYVTPEGDVGFMVTPDGDLQHVFNNGARKGAGREAVALAIENGARTLDAYDGHLPKYYAQFGFRETGRMKFVDEYAPDGWDYETNGRPDVVFMALTDEPNYAKSTTYFDDWDEAKALSKDSAIEDMTVWIPGGRERVLNGPAFTLYEQQLLKAQKINPARGYAADPELYVALMKKVWGSKWKSLQNDAEVFNTFAWGTLTSQAPLDLTEATFPLVRAVMGKDGGKAGIRQLRQRFEAVAARLPEEWRNNAVALGTAFQLSQGLAFTRASLRRMPGLTREQADLFDAEIDSIDRLMRNAGPEERKELAKQINARLDKDRRFKVGSSTSRVVVREFDVPMQRGAAYKGPAAGLTRVYRGEGGRAGSVEGGRWFTTRRDVAEDYAAPNSPLKYVDLTPEELDQFRTTQPSADYPGNHAEVRLDDRTARRQIPLDNREETTFAVIGNPNTKMKGAGTNESWGQVIRWINNGVFDSDSAAVQRFLKLQPGESRIRYAMRMASILPGIDMKTGILSVEGAGPAIMGHGAMDTHMIRHVMRRARARGDLPKLKARLTKGYYKSLLTQSLKDARGQKNTFTSPTGDRVFLLTPEERALPWSSQKADLMRQRLHRLGDESMQELYNDDEVLRLVAETGGKVNRWGGNYAAIEEYFNTVIKGEEVARLRAGGKHAAADAVEGLSGAEWQWLTWDRIRAPVLDPHVSLTEGANLLPHRNINELDSALEITRGGNVDPHALLLQQSDGNVLGFNALLEDGTRLVGATELATPLTIWHEMLHVIEADLDPSLKDAVLAEFRLASGSKRKTWNTDVSEWFVEQASLYFRSGQQSNRAMRTAFEYFRKTAGGIESTIATRQSSTVLQKARTKAIDKATEALADARPKVQPARTVLGKTQRRLATARTNLKRAKAKTGVDVLEGRYAEARDAAGAMEELQREVRESIRDLRADIRAAKQRVKDSAGTPSAGGTVTALRRKEAALAQSQEQLRQLNDDILPVAREARRETGDAFRGAQRRTSTKAFEDARDKALAEHTKAAKALADAERAVQRAADDLTSARQMPQRAKPVKINLPEQQAALREVMEDIFGVPDPANLQASVGSPVTLDTNYNLDEEVAFSAADFAAQRAEESAFTTHFYKRGRHVIERSVNHPYFGLYPASYMWGKILPELLRFLIKEPFGVPAPLGGLLLANNVYRQLMVQQNFDEEFRRDMANNSDFFHMISMMTPAMPWEVPVNAPNWIRRVAAADATYQEKLAAGDPEAANALMSGEELAKTAGDTLSYAFGPMYTGEYIAGGITHGVGLVSNVLGQAQEQFEGIFGRAQAPVQPPAYEEPIERTP